MDERREGPVAAFLGAKEVVVGRENRRSARLKWLVGGGPRRLRSRGRECGTSASVTASAEIAFAFKQDADPHHSRTARPRLLAGKLDAL